MKNPRSSPKTRGFSRTGPPILVSSRSMRRASLAGGLLEAVGDEARDRERRRSCRRRSVAHVQAGAALGEGEIIVELPVAADRRGARAGPAGLDVLHAQIR